MNVRPVVDMDVICQQQSVRLDGRTRRQKSTYQHLPPLTCCEAISNCSDLQLPPGTFVYAARKGVQRMP